MNGNMGVWKSSLMKVKGRGSIRVVDCRLSFPTFHFYLSTWTFSAPFRSGVSAVCWLLPGRGGSGGANEHTFKSRRKPFPSVTPPSLATCFLPGSPQHAISMALSGKEAPASSQRPCTQQAARTHGAQWGKHFHACGENTLLTCLPPHFTLNAYCPISQAAPPQKPPSILPL